jgi:DHA2 family integral membrane protein (MFS transporter)
VAQHLGTAGRSLLGPADGAFVHAMHITTLVAAALALVGGLVVLRWMPGRPQPAQQSSEGGYEAELAIMEEDMLKTAEREG